MDEPELRSTNEEKGIGPIAGALIIVLLLAIAGVYFFLQGSSLMHAQPPQQELNA